MQHKAAITTCFVLLTRVGPAQQLPEAVQELLGETCADCHSGAKAKAGFDIERIAERAGSARLGDVMRIRDRVTSREMPPVDFGELDEDELRTIVEWADRALTSGLVDLEFDPGSVVIRRLSRVEYDNTVEDLFGVATPTSAQFPSDDLGYGFDNIGAAMSFSQLHIEKYLAAAEDIAARVIDTEDPANPTVRRMPGANCSIESGRGNTRGDGVKLITSGTVRAKFALPRSGRYEVAVIASGDQAGGEPARMDLEVGGKRLDRFDVPNRPNRPLRYSRELDLNGSAASFDISFINDFYNPRHPEPKRRDRNLIIEEVELRGPLDQRSVPGSAWLQQADPGPRAKLRRRAVRIAQELCLRAWRRPPSRRDVSRLADLVDQTCKSGEPFPVGLRALLHAVLVSPRFLYRIERPGSRELDGYELATRLSYFLWSSTPDAELMRSAKSGKLRRVVELERQARRMLDDERARALATTFCAQWLELRNLAESDPDPKRFPQFDAGLRRAMRHETELLFATVLAERRSIYELCAADFTFVNEQLAKHYGIDGVQGPEFRRVAAPRPGGVLGHASVLTLTSNPTRTSPVKRGKWILDNLLDSPPPPPEPGFDSFPDEAAVHAAATLRVQLAQHRADPQCAVCHVRMDGLGLALERFDAIGRRRESDDGVPIDATGELPGGRKIDDIAGVGGVLAGNPAFMRALASKLFVFAVGREPTLDDRLALERMRRSLPGLDSTLEDLILGIIRLEAFRSIRSAKR